MTQFKTLKLSNILRQKTELRPVLRCKTRWSGSYNMVKRYFELKDFIKQLADDGVISDDFVLKTRTIQELQLLLQEMEKLNSVMLSLQSSDIDLLDSRKLFDHTLKSFPTMSSYLATDAIIVHSPEFENAVVSLLKKVFFIFFIIHASS